MAANFLGVRSQVSTRSVMSIVLTTTFVGPVHNGRHNSNIFRKLLFRFCPFELLLYRASPRGGFHHVRGTEWDVLEYRKKDVNQLPGSLGTGVRLGEGRNLHHSRAESRACTNLNQFATKIKGCIQWHSNDVTKCSGMSHEKKKSFGPVAEMVALLDRSPKKRLLH